MLKHYLVIALRNLWKSRLFSAINIAGLAIGMATCTLILLYVQHELSYDRFHPAAERLYRVLTIDKAIGVSSQFVGVTLPPLGPALAASFPEVESFCRVGSGQRQLLEVNPERHVYAENVVVADSNFFSVFGFKLLKGDPLTCLNEPFAQVLTVTLARRLFGNDDPMGRTLRTANGNTVTVTGLMADLPDNTALKCEAITSLATAAKLARQQQANVAAQLPPGASPPPIFLDNWNLIAMPLYVRLKDSASAAELNAKLTPFLRSKGVEANFEVTLQPIADLHLRSTRVVFDTTAGKGDISSVYTLAVVAVLVLLIASFNFMNLSTARAAGRAKEVGLRKVVGSSRRQLMTQFLGESVVLALIAMVLALSLVELLLPWLNGLAGKHLRLNLFTNPLLAAGLLGLVVLVGVLAGLYPALVLSRFRPVDVLKGSFQSGAKGRFLRRALVVTQFAMSIALIIGTLIVNRQLAYIHTKDLGYNRDQMLILDLNDLKLQQKADAFRTELAASPEILATSAAFNLPGRQLGRNGVRLEGEPESQIRIWSQLVVDWDFIPTMGMDIVKGRNFDRAFASDTINAVLINERAAREIGGTDPLGARLYNGPQDTVGSVVVGVVKDFHFASLRQEIEPLIVFLVPNTPPTLTLRLRAGGIPAAMKFVEQTWKKVYPDHPFVYSFLDQEFEQLYKGDANFARLGSSFSILAIFIACLGLFGLASHTTEQRRKEIGVRKVLGASVASISSLLIMDFIRWVALANLVAWPLAFLAAQRWLGSFVYHASLSWVPFVAAGAGALLIAVITVLAQVIRAASANPIKALRYE